MIAGCNILLRLEDKRDNENSDLNIKQKERWDKKYSKLIYFTFSSSERPLADAA